MSMEGAAQIKHRFRMAGVAEPTDAQCERLLGFIKDYQVQGFGDPTVLVDFIIDERLREPWQIAEFRHLGRIINAAIQQEKEQPDGGD